MILAELLKETGNNPAPFELIPTGDADYAEIAARDIGLSVQFTRVFDPTDSYRVFIEFTVNGRMDRTGGGNAVKILSTVNAILIEYLHKFLKPKDLAVAFLADAEPSRIKLYDRLVPTVGRILGNNWVYSEDLDSIALGRGVKDYVWLKKTQQLKEVAVASTWITELVYSRARKTLTMTLNNGKQYSIPGISRQSFDRWKAAPSKGQYFHQNIRDRFQIERTR